MMWCGAHNAVSAQYRYVLHWPMQGEACRLVRDADSLLVAGGTVNLLAPGIGERIQVDTEPQA